MKEKNILHPLLLSAAALLFLLLNWMVPFIIDDNIYARSFEGVTSMMEDTNPDQTINSFSDFCKSVFTHYKSINDRYIVVILEHFLCIINKHISDIFQTATIFILLLLTGSEKGKGMSIAKMAVSLFLLLFLLSYPCIFYEGVVVPINYIFPAAMVLALLHCCDRYTSLNSLSIFLLSILAIIAAWCHECISVPISGGMLFMLLTKRKDLSKGIITIYTAFIIATAIMVLGPANLQRFANNNADVSANAYGMSVLQYHLIVLRYMRITYLWAMLMLIFYARKKQAARQYIADNTLFIASLAASIPFSLFIGGVNCRVVFGAEIISTVLTLRLLWQSKTFLTHSHNIATASLLASISLLTYIIIIQQPYISALKEAERQVRESENNICTLTLEPQDTLPPQIQKYIVGTLNPFQLEQIRWKYKKDSLTITQACHK